MAFENLRKYLIIALIGYISFLLGYIEMYFFFKYVISSGSGIFNFIMFNFCVIFIGLIPVFLYLEKSMKFIYLACIIALLFVGSLLIVYAFTPQLVNIVFFHVGTTYLWHRFYIDWHKFFLETFHVHIYDFLRYIVISISFGLLSVPVLWKRKRYIPLIIVIMFLGQMLSLAIPNGLGLEGGWTFAIISQGIFGVFFSVTVVRFYWGHTINYYDIIKEKFKK